ncbi:MAG TPA: tail fiber domain-containing protein [Bacteroidota bacterium]|nr:tail fiber domain-containing protein [Bacteroidota bacterium]
MKRFLFVLSLNLTLCAANYGQAPSSSASPEPAPALAPANQFKEKSSPFAPATPAAVLSRTMSYQGLLTNAVGTALADGSYGLQFDLFDSSSGGPSRWTETQNGVALHKGTFSVSLGSTTPFNVDFNKKMYVEVTVLSGPAGPSYPMTFSPRSELTSAPSSLAPWAPNGTDIYFNSGHVGVGTPTPGLNSLPALRMEIADSDGNNSDIAIRVAGSVGGYPALNLVKTRGSLFSPASVSNQDYIGYLRFAGFDGSSYLSGAGIFGIVDSTPSPGVVPGRLSFFTRGSASGYTEKMSLDRNGNLGLGTSSPVGKLHLHDWTNSSNGSRLSLTQASSGTGAYDGLAVICTWPNSFLWNYENGYMALGTNNVERIHIDGAGHVGIAAATPQHTLQIGDSFDGHLGIDVSDGSPDAGFIRFGDNTGWKLFLGRARESSGGILNTGATGAVMTIIDQGNVGIGTTTPSQRLQVIGNICATGTIGSCSDMRYKKDISPLSSSLTKVLSLRGVSYNWRSDEFSEKNFTKDRQIGLIAQEVEKLYPEVVQTDANGYKSVDYGRLTPVLIEAIKEQQKEIDDLKAMIKLLAADKQHGGNKSIGEVHEK